MKLRKKLVIGIATAVAVLGAAGGMAFAVWTVGGGGSGAGAASVANSLVLTAVTPTGLAATLYPGGPAGPVYLTVNNPNPFAVTITSITWGSPLSGNTTACPNTNIMLDSNAPTTVSIPVPPGPPTGAISIPGVLDLIHAAPNGCQGVSFSIPMTITATQQ